MCACACVRACVCVCPIPTLCAASAPQAGMGQHLFVLADCLVVVSGLGATHPAGVQPVVRPHGDGHKAEGAESPRGGQQHQDAPVAHPHLDLLLPTGSENSKKLSSPVSNLQRVEIDRANALLELN